MIKNSKQNKIQQTSSELLNNFKHINKSDKKFQEYLHPLSVTLKKSQSTLKKIQKTQVQGSPFFETDDSKKHLDIKASTHRSNLKKNIQEQRKQDIKGFHPSQNHIAQQYEIYEARFGRTFRFKTLEEQKKKNQKNTTQKYKLLHQTLAPISNNKPFKNILADLNSKFRVLSNNFENNGYGTFISDIVLRFKDIIATLIQSLITQTVSKINLQQSVMQDLNNNLKDLQKQNTSLQLSLQKLRQQHKLALKKLVHFQNLYKKQREILLLKLQKQRAINVLIYELRKKGLNLDSYYKTLKQKTETSISDVVQIQLYSINNKQLQKYKELKFNQEESQMPQCRNTI